MKAPYLVNRCRHRSLLNFFDFALIDVNALGQDNIAQKYDFGSEKVALLKIPIKLLLR